MGEGVRRVGGGAGGVGWGWVGRVKPRFTWEKTTQKPSKQPGNDPSPRQEEAETQKPKRGEGSREKG